MNAEPPLSYFEDLDDLLNVEFKSKRALLGGTRLRFAAARQAAGGPMTLQAARLLSGLPKGSAVFMTTGAGNPTTLPQGETDGPSGAAFLARMLSARGHEIVLLSDEAYLPGIAAAFDAVGLSPGQGLRVESFPLGAAAGQEAVRGLMDRFPDAGGGVFIEKPGPNDRGVFHTSSGKPKVSESVAHLHLLTERLSASGKVTVAVGDGGNEIGFGRVGRALEAGMPLARDCGCGCGGGVVNATTVDSLVAASTSNWGAYGIAAAMAMLTRDGSGMLPVGAVRTSVEASVSCGANDGYSGENVSTVDGTSLAASEAIYELCHELVRQAEALR